MTAGVIHSVLKNSQVEVVHEMDRTQRRINDHEDVIRSLQVKIDKKLNIYELRDDLKLSGSDLVLVSVSAIEKIPSHPVPATLGGAVAVTKNSNPSLAQRSP